MSDDLEKRITAKYILDSTGFNSGLKGIDSNLKQNQASLKLASEGVITFGKNSETLKGVQQELSKQIDLQKQKVDLYKESIEKANIKLKDSVKERDNLRTSLEKEKLKYEEVIKQYGKESEEAKKAKENVDKLTDEYKKKEKAVESTAKSINNYTVRMTQAEAQMVKTEGQLKKINSELGESNNKWIKASESLKVSSEGLKNAGAKISSVGDSILKVTAPLAALGVASTKMSMDYGDALAQVSTISDETQVPIKELGKQILKLSNDTGIAVTGLSGSVYDALSAGQQTGDVMGFVERNTKLAKGGFADIGSTIDLTTSILNAYKMKSEEVADVSDILIQVQNKGKTTVKELSADMGKVIPTAVATNTSLRQLGTAYGLMTANGIKTAETTTYVNSLLNELSKTGTDADEALKKVANKSFSDLMKEGKSLGEVLQILDEYAKKNKLSLKDMFGSAEAGKAALVLSTNAGNDFADMLKDMNNTAGMTDDAFNKVSNTAGEQFRRNINKLKNEGIRLGDALAPLLEKGINLVSTITDKISGMSEEQLQNYAKWTMMAMGVGGFLKIAGGAVVGIGNVVGAVGTLSKVLGTATVATEVAGTAGAVAGGAGGLGALAGGLGAVLLPAAGVVAAVGAVGLAAYGIHKTLSEEVVPSIDLFADKVETTGQVYTEYGVIAETTTTKISEGTKKAVGSYMELDKSASNALFNLRINGAKTSDDIKTTMVQKFTETFNSTSGLSEQMKTKLLTEFTAIHAGSGAVTEQMKNDMVAKYTELVNSSTTLTAQQKEKMIQDYADMYNNTGTVTETWKNDMITKYNTMAQQIKNGLKQKQDEQMTDLQGYFATSNALTVEEEAKIMQAEKDSWEGRKGAIDVYTKEINTIIERAYNEHRTLKEEELKRLSELQGLEKNEAIKVLSETELESKVILERIKQNSDRLTAEQASEAVKNANETKDKTIKAAEDQYNKALKIAVRLKDEGGAEAEKQAQKIIDEATKQRDESIKKANEMCEGIKDKIQQGNSGIWDAVDRQTGGIKDRWDKIKDSIGGFFTWIGNKISDATTNLNNLGNSVPVDQNWTGTNYFKGGLTTLHEKGYEVYSLPKSTRIYNHEASEELVKQTAESVATKVANSVLKNFEGVGGSSNITIEVPLYLEGREVARASARYMNEELSYQNNLAWR